MEGCGKMFSARDVEKFGSKQIYLKYLKFKENIDVDLDPNLRWCGRSGCLKFVKKGKTSQVECECGNVMCFKCGVEWHMGKCASDRHVNDRDYLQWAAEQGGACTNCPKCKARIEKIGGGCNHLTCQRCDYQWCWICGAKYNEEHFNEWNVFGCSGM